MTGFWKGWMTVWCWGLLGVGGAFAASAVPALDLPVRLFYDLVLWPMDGNPATFEPMVRFLNGLVGSIMVGWAICVFTLVRAADAVGAPVWRGLTASVLVWYVLDSAISIGSGIAMNAVTNTIFVATFLPPVLASGVLKSAAPGRVAAA